MNNLDFNFFCSECRKSQEYRLKNCFVGYRTKSYAKGDYLALTGDRVRDLVLLVRGSIAVSFVLKSGVVIRSTEHQAPYPMGALALLGKENRYRVDIVATQECEVIAVSREQIEQQIMNCREFMLSFFDYSTSKLDLFVDHLALLSQRSIAAKLAYYIFTCSPDGKSYQFTRSVRSLAEHLCVERPSLSRVIAKLVDDGIITYAHGKGQIINQNLLKSYIE